MRRVYEGRIFTRLKQGFEEEEEEVGGVVGGEDGEERGGRENEEEEGGAINGRKYCNNGCRAGAGGQRGCGGGV